jgi:hypothetical protein
MNDKRPSDYRFTCIQTISEIDMRREGSYVERVVKNDIARQMASHIAEKEVKKEVGDFHTTFRMEVYLLDAEELYRLIKHEAQRIAFRPMDLDLGKTK